MIKRLMTVKDVGILFNVKDDAASQFPCDRNAWVQWMVEHISSPKVGIWVTEEDGVITSYIVLLNTVTPPLSNTVIVLYLWSNCSHKKLRKLIEKAKEWVVEIGSKKAIITVPLGHDKKYMASFGGNNVATIYEWEVE